MQALYLAFVVLASFQLSANAQGLVASETRALIAPNAAIDAHTFDEYQQCLARIGLGQETKVVVSMREVCKNKAMDAAYKVPEMKPYDVNRVPSKPGFFERIGVTSPRPVNAGSDRAAWQQEEWKPFKQ